MATKFVFILTKLDNIGLVELNTVVAVTAAVAGAGAKGANTTTAAATAVTSACVATTACTTHAVAAVGTAAVTISAVAFAAAPAPSFAISLHPAEVVVCARGCVAGSCGLVVTSNAIITEPGILSAAVVGSGASTVRGRCSSRK